MSAMTYLHDLGIVHGDLKGVRSVFPRSSPPLTTETGEHPRRQHRRCPCDGLWAYEHGRSERFPFGDCWFPRGDLSLDEPGAVGFGKFRVQRSFDP